MSLRQGSVFSTGTKEEEVYQSTPPLRARPIEEMRNYLSEESSPI